MPKHNKLTFYHYTEDLFQQGIDDNILIPGKYILISVGTNPSSWNPPHLVVGTPLPHVGTLSRWKSSLYIELLSPVGSPFF